MSPAAIDMTALDATRQDDEHTAKILRIILLARRQGATVRTLARMFGYSKSAMGRLLRDIDALPPGVLSQLGQTRDVFSRIAAGAPSQMGQSALDDEGAS